MSRTTGDRHPTGETRKRPLDVVHDRERDRERLATVLARHRDRRVTVHRLDERGQLEAKRLSLGRLELNALDERFERLRALRVPDEGEQIDVSAKAIEFAGAGGEIQRQI